MNEGFLLMFGLTLNINRLLGELVNSEDLYGSTVRGRHETVVACLNLSYIFIKTIRSLKFLKGSNCWAVSHITNNLAQSSPFKHSQ